MEVEVADLPLPWIALLRIDEVVLLRREAGTAEDAAQVGAGPTVAIDLRLVADDPGLPGDGCTDREAEVTVDHEAGRHLVVVEEANIKDEAPLHVI